MGVTCFRLSITTRRSQDITPCSLHYPAIFFTYIVEHPPECALDLTQHPAEVSYNQVI